MQDSEEDKVMLSTMTVMDVDFREKVRRALAGIGQKQMEMGVGLDAAPHLLATMVPEVEVETGLLEQTVLQVGREPEGVKLAILS